MNHPLDEIEWVRGYWETTDTGAYRKSHGTHSVIIYNAKFGHKFSIIDNDTLTATDDQRVFPSLSLAKEQSFDLLKDIYAK